jgi:hypothetical protein
VYHWPEGDFAARILVCITGRDDDFAVPILVCIRARGRIRCAYLSVYHWPGGRIRCAYLSVYHMTGRRIRCAYLSAWIQPGSAMDLRIYTKVLDEDSGGDTFLYGYHPEGSGFVERIVECHQLMIERCLECELDACDDYF